MPSFDAGNINVDVQKFPIDLTGVTIRGFRVMVNDLIPETVIIMVGANGTMAWVDVTDGVIHSCKIMQPNKYPLPVEFTTGKEL